MILPTSGMGGHRVLKITPKNPSMKRPLRYLALPCSILLLGAIELKAEAMSAKASDNRIYAQALVNDLAQSNPDLIIVGFHAIAPGSTAEVMIASTLDRIGEKDDDEDLVVVSEQEMILAASIKEPAKFKVHMPMTDSS